MRHVISLSRFAIFASLITLLGTNGCIPVSHHAGADLSTLDTFKIEKGTTTEKQLVDQFGPPGSTITRDDGRRILHWNDARSEGTVNVAGMFVNRVGDQNVTRKSLTATIRDGIVIDYTIAEGKNVVAM